jgi:hypothetical protein
MELTEPVSSPAVPYNLAVKVNDALVHLLEMIYAPQERALPGSRGSDQAGDLSPADIERHALQHLDVPI